MNDVVIKIEDLYKQYRLGVIGGGTLQADLQSWWARVRGKDDPNIRIGTEYHNKNEKFMALNGINLEVNKGDTLGIIGGNGAGKSTLLKILSRVTAPTKGNVYIRGRISSMLEVGTGFNGELTGRENVYLNGAILGMSKAEVDSKIEQIIDFSEVQQFIDTPVKRYSSGMYVRLAFAVAAHLDSEILVMDEVLAVGDMKFQQKCLGKMGDVANSEGRTILYVSHNMNTIRQLCNRCIVLDKGRIIYNGDVEKAISLYMDKNTTKRENIIDLTEVKREGKLTEKVKMKTLEVLNNDKNMVFSINSGIQLKLTYYSHQIVNQMFLRTIIKYADNTPVGMAFTHSELKSIPQHENFITFELYPAMLTEGVYSITLSMYEKNDFGTQTFVDVVNNAFNFEIQSYAMDNMQWRHGIWGYVLFPEIKIIETN